MKLSTSHNIKQRIKEANASYKASDNISEFISPGEVADLVDEVEEQMEKHDVRD